MRLEKLLHSLRAATMLRGKSKATHPAEKIEEYASAIFLVNIFLKGDLP
jgi:hypothetical protein